jgi:two-component system sensor histidine kinase TctE
VGETLEKRAQLANEIIKGVILPQFVILPVALALVWFALSRGLSPLADCRSASARRPDDLAHRAGQVPEEISPLVRSLNDMLAPVADHRHAEALHRRRGPPDEDPAGRHAHAVRTGAAPDRPGRNPPLAGTAGQEFGSGHAPGQPAAGPGARRKPAATGGMAPLELDELARSVVQDWVPASFAQRIDLGFERRITPSSSPATRDAARAAVQPDRQCPALHTADGGRVTVRVRSDEAEAGHPRSGRHRPRHPPAERANVFERFYRILGTQAPAAAWAWPSCARSPSSTAPSRDHPQSAQQRSQICRAASFA